MLNEAPVRIQWASERNLRLDALPHRTIQVDLSGEAVTAFVGEWITNIEDNTPLWKQVEAAAKKGDLEEADRLAPKEVAYPLPQPIDQQDPLFYETRRIGPAIPIPDSLLCK